MTITLQNHRLTVQIDDLGAQLCSVKDAKGTEYIWQADPAIWGRHAPILFPIIGRLKDSQYELDGKTYTIPSHGFARDSRFEVAEATDLRAVFRLTHSEATLAVWPFPFTLTVTYELEEDRLIKAVRVDNPGDRPMLYELGGHDGFVAPSPMDDWAISIPGLDTIQPYGMDAANMITPKTAIHPLENSRIPLKPAVYGLDTIILGDLPVSQAALVDKDGHPRVTLDFPGFPYLGLWTADKPVDTNYVCIEPWTTLPDATFVGRALADKHGIRTLAPGGHEVLSYTTTFHEIKE